MRRLPALILTLLFSLALNGCYTMQVQYRADVVQPSKGGNKQKAIYTEDVDLGGWMTACMVTGVFFGGTCWAYLGMPFEYQMRDVRHHAQAQVAEQTKDKSVNFTNEESGLKDWCYSYTPKLILAAPKASVIVKTAQDRRSFFCGNPN